jgi:hypothetical protein
MDAFHVLVYIAIGLAVGAIVKPSWPLCAVSALLLGVALLIK